MCFGDKCHMLQRRENTLAAIWYARVAQQPFCFSRTRRIFLVKYATTANRIRMLAVEVKMGHWWAGMPGIYLHCNYNATGSIARLTPLRCERAINWTLKGRTPSAGQ